MFSFVFGTFWLKWSSKQRCKQKICYKVGFLWIYEEFAKLAPFYRPFIKSV